MYLYTGVPPLTECSLPRIPNCSFWLIYAQLGDFCVSRGPPTVPLTQIFRNEFFLCPKIRVRQGSSVFEIVLIHNLEYMCFNLLCDDSFQFLLSPKVPYLKSSSFQILFISKILDSHSYSKSSSF